MKITEALLAEHLVFHNLFDHIEVTAPLLKTLAEIKSLAALMESMLKAHSDTEDELFIGPLEHCFEQIGQSETFHAEHRRIEEKLAQVQKARTFEVAKAILLAAIAASREHFDKEERIVFPMAERVLKAKTLSELGAEWLRKRQAALK